MYRVLLFASEKQISVVRLDYSFLSPLAFIVLESLHAHRLLASPIANPDRCLTALWAFRVQRLVYQRANSLSAQLMILLVRMRAEVSAGPESRSRLYKRF